MSVINQMLKDLDERNPEQVAAQPSPHVIEKPASKYRNTFLLLFVIVVINIAGWFVWSIYQENQALKSQQNNQLPAAPIVKVSSKNVEEANAQADSSEHEPVDIQPLQKSDSKSSTDNELQNQAIENNVNNSVHNNEKLIAKVQGAGVSGDAVQREVESELVAKSLEKYPEHLPEKKSKQVQRPTLSVSRKQLSPQQLITRKEEQAQKAISSNQPSKAEELYEDILLIDSDRHDVRKQLAALWYGRKAYQAALNLLKQGSAIDYNNSEFRLMKARIYLTTGQTNNALNELLTLKDVNNAEYQAMIANTAQQLQQYQTAVYAYQQLTQLQPSDGRWWLGLAIAYDSDAKFESAINAYKKAITLSGISDSSMAFARQRIQELGE